MNSSNRVDTFARKVRVPRTADRELLPQEYLSEDTRPLLTETKSAQNGLEPNWASLNTQIPKSIASGNQFATKSAQGVRVVEKWADAEIQGLNHSNANIGNEGALGWCPSTRAYLESLSSALLSPLAIPELIYHSVGWGRSRYSSEIACSLSVLSRSVPSTLKPVCHASVTEAYAPEQYQLKPCR